MAVDLQRGDPDPHGAEERRGGDAAVRTETVIAAAKGLLFAPGREG